MVPRIGCELVPNSGPALIVDQGRLLTGVEFTLVSYAAGVNWVREQCVEMTAREGFAAALGAIRCRAAFRAKPETVGLLLDPAHAAELTIESEDAALRRGSLEIAAREPAIVIAVSRQQPTLVLLAANVGLAGFALRRERIEFLLEPFLGGFAGVDRATSAARVSSRHRRPVRLNVVPARA